jgi:hypothetical protein
MMRAPAASDRAMNVAFSLPLRHNDSTGDRGTKGATSPLSLTGHDESRRTAK